MTHKPEPPPYLSLDVLWSHVFTHLHWFVSVFGTLTAVFRWRSGGGVITRMARVRLRVIEQLVRRLIIARAAALATIAGPLRAKTTKTRVWKIIPRRVETDDPLTWRARFCVAPLAHYGETVVRQGGQPLAFAQCDRRAFAAVARRLEGVRRVIAKAEACAIRLARRVPRDVYIFGSARRVARGASEHDWFVLAQAREHAGMALRASFARAHPLDSS